VARLSFIIVLLVVLVGCDGDSVECFPGTEWSDRSQGCVRFIPDNSVSVRFIPE